MCKAHVLRFRCAHGVLMSIETCRFGPCPVLKTTGVGLPQQPYKCYNCQVKFEQEALKLIPSFASSRTSSVDSFDSAKSFDSTSSASSIVPLSTSPTKMSISQPLPNVAVQPKGCVRMNQSSTTSAKSFTFACHSSDHFATPHYSDLPSFLPHQDHSCPPCQMEGLRQQSYSEAARDATKQYPSLTAEMLVHGGRTFDPEYMTKPSLEMYVEEKVTEERELWLHCTRKWTQDLKKARVLVAEEDGLGLLG